MVKMSTNYIKTETTVQFHLLTTVNGSGFLAAAEAKAERASQERKAEELGIRVKLLKKHFPFSLVYEGWQVTTHC